MGLSEIAESADTGAERHANFMVANTIKSLSPVMQIAASEQAAGRTHEEVQETIKRVVIKCRSHAVKAVSAAQVPESEVQWGVSYFASVIAGELAKAWPRMGKAALEIDWSNSLTQIATPTLYQGLPPNWRGTPAEFSVAATVMNAMQGVMTEYYRCTLFHNDPSAVSDRLSTWLLEAGTYYVNEIAKHRDLSDPSRVSLFQSAVKHGGNILANLWNTHSRRILQELQTSTDRAWKARIVKSGYGLDAIKNDLHRQVEGLVALTLKTLDHLDNGSVVAQALEASKSARSQSSHGMD